MSGRSKIKIFEDLINCDYLRSLYLNQLLTNILQKSCMFQ